MKKVLFSLWVIMSGLPVYGQDEAISVPMQPDHWEFQPDQVEFITHRSVPAVRGLNGGAQIYLKDMVFEDGTIEYDVELNENGFIGINFRMGEDRQNTENFYIRSFWPVSPLGRTTLQYATVIDGVSMWDLTDDYQAAASIHQEGWNHVKLVVSGKQMVAYVNDMDKPALYVPILEGETASGGISLGGNAIYSNLVIHPDATEGLPVAPGYDPTINDPRYLRSWLVTQPVDFPFGRDVIQQDLPDSSAQWTNLQAEHRALINLSRALGSTDFQKRRLTWLKTTIHSETIQERKISLGFSDEVWIFINGQLLLVDKNYFGSPGMKEPRGRCTIENTTFTLPLQEGDNEILIGIGNNFYGWGIIARLDRTDGLSYK